jgi:nitrate reductase gamma subunit
MAVVYILRLRWLLKFKAGKERQPETGLPDTNMKRGILYSWANIFMPWAMESTRAKMLIYLQFALFHIGVVAAIGLSFIIPYLPSLLTVPYIIPIIQIITGLACLIGIIRFIRRVGDKYMRAISTPDDYFSLLLLTVWFFFATLSVPNNGGWIQITYFIMTAFFLIYVPFSKISHYLYYPFTRYYFGKSMGYRGTYPIKRASQS